MDLRFLWPALLFAVAGAIAETFRVVMPTTGSGSTVRGTVSAAVFVAAALIFPPPWAVLLSAAATVVGQVVNRRAWFKITFNASQMAIAIGAASSLWWWASPDGLVTSARNVPWLLAAVGVHFVVNTWLVSGIVAFSAGTPLRATWWRTYRHIIPAWLGMLLVGALIAVLWRLAPWTIALAAVPLAGLYYALRNTVTLEVQTVDALFNLADILDARDPYTHGHSLRVGEYAQQLALHMGASNDTAHAIFLAGRLHDIGKCAVDNEVLRKTGPLTEREREHMCQHADVGGNMLANFELFKECAHMVRGHHERWDGGGYPDGLAASGIPWGARVIAVADAFDAMVTDRPYRQGLGEAEAVRRLEAGAGTQWDPAAVAAFLELLRGGKLATRAAAPPRPILSAASASA